MDDIQNPLIDKLFPETAQDSKPRRLSLDFVDMAPQPKKRSRKMSLEKSVLRILNGEKPSGQPISRLAFEEDPNVAKTTGEGYKRKSARLLPNDILKRIAIQDDLVAAILLLRSKQVSAFGRPQPTRFTTGYKLVPIDGVLEALAPEERERIKQKIAAAELKIMTCGETEGWAKDEQIDFSQFLQVSARNACHFGQLATESVFVTDLYGNRRFHSFRPLDAGTIYPATPKNENMGSGVRKQAVENLESITGKPASVDVTQEHEEYAWVQVIQGNVRQFFTADECLVHNFYPVTDVELNGFPLTPLDTVISAVTTHISISAHNQAYFVNGRASRGMIVITSEAVDDSLAADIRQQFQASINSTANAFRMPVFSLGDTEGKIEWVPIDNSSRDQEFQYLSDNNARVILSAFQVSPEELPGYTHLSKGTNSQALSESNNEYKLEAARDVGIRPLLAQLQNFVNARIVPLIDPELSRYCTFMFLGLDAETQEKESIRLQSDQAVHMTVDEILRKVNKQPVGAAWGGELLLNPLWLAVLDKYVPVGMIMEHFFGMEGASLDPRYNYLRDPFYFNQCQVLQIQKETRQAGQQPPGGGGRGFSFSAPADRHTDSPTVHGMATKKLQAEAGLKMQPDYNEWAKQNE